MTVEDRLAVAETIYRYATGVDMRDFTLYRSIFAARVAVDFTSYSGGQPDVVTGDEWVERTKAVLEGAGRPDQQLNAIALRLTQRGPKSVD